MTPPAPIRLAHVSTPSRSQPCASLAGAKGFLSELVYQICVRTRTGPWKGKHMDQVDQRGRPSRAKEKQRSG